jgi:hypothetical protein
LTLIGGADIGEQEAVTCRSRKIAAIEFPLKRHLASIVNYHGERHNLGGPGNSLDRLAHDLRR